MLFKELIKELIMFMQRLRVGPGYLLQGHPCYRGEARSLIAHGVSSRMETAAGNLWSLAPAVLVCRLGLVTAATLIQPQTTGNK